jgi:hypothetical protein
MHPSLLGILKSLRRTLMRNGFEPFPTKDFRRPWKQDSQSSTLHPGIFDQPGKYEPFTTLYTIGTDKERIAETWAC